MICVVAASTLVLLTYSAVHSVQALNLLPGIIIGAYISKLG